MADHVVLYIGPIVSRKEARASGLKRYFTGKPCRHGHICERQSRASACVECVRIGAVTSPYEYVKIWREKNPEKRTEEARRYRAKYPDKVRKNSREWNRRNAERLRPIWAEKARIKRKSDPDGNRRRIAKYRAKREIGLSEIAGRPRPSICDICRENNGGIVFDHCHESGKFRGWICDRCNKVLGLIRDSTVLLQKMSRYIKESNDKTDGEKTECAPLERFFGAR